MSSILGIVQQQQQTSIDEDKLQVLCVEKMSGIILDWTGKIFKIFRKQNNSNLFENFILKTCLAARKRTLNQVSEAQFKTRQDLPLPKLLKAVMIGLKWHFPIMLPL